MYHGLTYAPPIEEFQAARFGKGLTILAGANNSGKSLALKSIKLRLGMTAYMLHPQRFYHVYEFGSMAQDPNEIANLESNFTNSFHQPAFNHEANFLDFQRAFTTLSNAKRRELMELAGGLLNTEITLDLVDPNNELSMRRINVGGHNLASASTGTRLLLTLLSTCMDERFSTVLVDEPELGLSPRVQQALSRFFQDENERRKHFPHLQAIYLSTHSHLFLDRRDITNNFSLTKTGDLIEFNPISTLSQFHELQFNLLGNTLEDLYLPAAVVVVEGKTDKPYLERVIQQRFPDRRITVTEAQGNTKAKINAFRDAMGDLDKSPYKSRIFVVLDSVHEYSTPAWLESHGVPKNNIRIWSRNGIEYYYPMSILCEIFNATPETIDAQLATDSDVVSVNGVTRRKVELNEEVLSRLNPAVELPEELSAFLDQIAAATQ